jgi:quercetin dioxygenase-like cupin family protein
MTVLLTRPGEGETWSSGGVRFRVLDDGRVTDGRIGLVQCDLDPGWAGPPQHVHRAHDETFLVLTGTVRFTSGRDGLLAPAGSVVTAPIGDPHTFANPDADAPASLVCTVAPERYIGYFRELADLKPTADGQLDHAAILEIMARYRTEPYRP